jgi:hypothetical protein
MQKYSLKARLQIDSDPKRWVTEMNKKRTSRLVGAVAGCLSGFILGASLLFTAEHFGLVCQVRTITTGILIAAGLGTALGIVFPRAVSATVQWVPWLPPAP